MNNENTELKEDWGWGVLPASINKQNDEDLIPCRIIGQGKDIYVVATSKGIVNAVVSGKMRYFSVDEDDFPVTGDWAGLSSFSDGAAQIEKVYPRESLLSRKAAGTSCRRQILAANMNKVFIVLSLDGGRNFNLRLLERYVTAVWDSGVEPIVLLNKIDLCSEVDERVFEAETAVPGVTVLPLSAETGQGMDALKQYLISGETVVLLGKSGVGKSALTNALMGSAVRKEGEVRSGDKKGRHTTTSRDLKRLPCGTIIMDSPGIKELQLMGDESAVDSAFSEIAELAEDCRFSDCTHSGEPGCAVSQALIEGVLDQKRYEAYLEYQKEMRYLSMKADKRLEILEQKKWKVINKNMRAHYKKMGHK